MIQSVPKDSPLFLSFVISSIAVWAVVKKKPLVKQFHYDSISKEEEGEGEKGGALREHKTDEDKKGIGDGWVTAVAAYPNSDLVASG